MLTEIVSPDLMLLNNEPTLQRSLRERRQLLRDHFHLIENKFALVEAIDASGSQECQDEVSDFFKKSIKNGCEGIMVKVLDHPGMENNGHAPNADKVETRATKTSQLLSTYEPGNVQAFKERYRMSSILMAALDKRMESWLKVKKDYVEGVSDSLDLVVRAIYVFLLHTTHLLISTIFR